jgi:hypothetical protein
MVVDASTPTQLSPATDALWLPSSRPRELGWLGLIGEAWRRRRRRYARLIVALVAAGLAGLVAYLAFSGGSAPVTGSGGSGADAPLAFAHTPYIGVSCPTANVTSCGRVGIAVWLARRGASEVDVVVAGVRVRLGPPPREGAGQSWRGFVHLPLAAMGLPRWWAGSPAKELTLQLRVRYGSSWRVGHMRLWLRPGWG